MTEVKPGQLKLMMVHDDETHGDVSRADQKLNRCGDPNTLADLQHVIRMLFEDVRESYVTPCAYIM